METYYRYDVVEAIAKLVTADSSASTTGPTYSTREIRVPGIQSVSVNLNREKQILRGNGKILATESSIDEIQIQLEVAKRDPNFEALIYGMAGWKTDTGQNLAFTDQSVPNAVGLWLRTNKVGVNGKDVVIYIPLFKADTQQLQQQQRNFATNQISGSGSFTESTFEVWREGVKTFESMAFEEQFRNTAASLYTSTDTTAPTITSTDVTGASTGGNVTLVASEALNPNTVNNSTVLLKTGAVIGSGTLVPCEVSISTDGLTITINPTSALTSAATYNAYCTTYVEDLAGNAFAAIDGITHAIA